MADVSILKCDAYEYDLVWEAVEKSFENLGGFERFISSGDRVLLKPNLLAAKKPGEATTTHPLVIRVLADFIQARGAACTIGDSPGGPFSNTMLRGVYRATGMETAAKESGAALNKNFKHFEKDTPNGFVLKKLTLADMINDADKIICVAKLKTHGMMTYTGAVKNMFGLVPGVSKMEYHLNLSDYDMFADALIDVCMGAPPVISFIDGIVGMEGRGPAAGSPFNSRLLLASPSPYHLDHAACRIIGLKTDEVPVLRRLVRHGIIAGDFSDINTCGANIEDYLLPSFDVPRTSRAMNLTRLPQFARRFINKHVQTRPVIDKKTCVSCDVCNESCPAKAISKKNNKTSIELGGCIRCYCCQELCPHKAVGIYSPLLSKIMRL
ncbi:MAG: DUF362 domain-containing protein [Defluviitaleaceae bacterium]|nr:DUF362 domain-containing protein [Defluviitaleaceae bacterium]